MPGGPAVDHIAEIVQLYGAFADGDGSKVFHNEDFGYTRVTVERPLRLRYQMTFDDKVRFLDACPELLEDVQAIDEALGRKPQRDWNAVWRRIEALLDQRGSWWRAREKKIFRDVFTQTEEDAESALAATGRLRSRARAGRSGKIDAAAYEPDPALRDFENVPLKVDVDDYFEREVRPHVPDAWMDRSRDKVGYEINFNRHFYRYQPPRALTEIDAELKEAEAEVLRLLREVTA